MKNLIVSKLTVEQVKQDNAREYNAKVWESNVARYAKHDNVQFFKIDADAVFSYSRFYVAYTIDGINFLNSFGYGSCLTSRPFAKVFINDFVINNGKVEFLPEGKANIMVHKYEIKNCDENRPHLKTLSEKLGDYFTTASIY